MYTLVDYFPEGDGNTEQLAGPVKIKTLQACPEAIPTLLQWYEKAFVVENIDIRKERETLLDSIERPQPLPLTLVGFVGELPVATMRVCENSLPDRPQYATWLDYTYSLPDVRDRGIIEAMLGYVFGYCKSLGRNELYAYLGGNNSRRVAALLSRGWKEIEHGGWEGHKTGVIMGVKF